VLAQPFEDPAGVFFLRKKTTPHIDTNKTLFDSFFNQINCTLFQRVVFPFEAELLGFLDFCFDLFR